MEQPGPTGGRRDLVRGRGLLPLAEPGHGTAHLAAERGAVGKSRRLRSAPKRGAALPVGRRLARLARPTAKEASLEPDQPGGPLPRRSQRSWRRRPGRQCLGVVPGLVCATLRYDRKTDATRTGPKQGDYRVLHGGSWYNDQTRCRCGYRDRALAQTTGPSTSVFVVPEPPPDPCALFLRHSLNLVAAQRRQHDVECMTSTCQKHSQQGSSMDTGSKPDLTWSGPSEASIRTSYDFGNLYLAHRKACQAWQASVGQSDALEASVSRPIGICAHDPPGLDTCLAARRGHWRVTRLS